MCVLLYYSCCGAADKLSPREREVGGALEGKGRKVGGYGEGGLTQTETDVSKPSYIRCCSCLAPLQPLYNISRERKAIYTIYCFGVRFDKDTDHE